MALQLACKQERHRLLTSIKIQCPKICKCSRNASCKFVPSTYDSRCWRLTSCGQAVEEIRKVLGDESVSIDGENLKFHGYSEWSPSNIETLPVAVVYPKSTEEVSRIMK